MNIIWIITFCLSYLCLFKAQPLRLAVFEMDTLSMPPDILSDLIPRFEEGRTGKTFF